ncbi:MAG: sigma-70 family RNA polymerase sigma factor [Crocinitomicaceae bacterium]|nr:sigma-70 family RNA polymerase sigma factor [Crocinitomicaceae bacterium]
MNERKVNKDFVKGKITAFEKIYDQYSDRVGGLCARYTRCEDDANDILQETFIRLYENRKRFDPNLPIWPWIKKITINSSLEYIRKNYKLVLTEDAENRFKEDSTCEQAELNYENENQKFKQKVLAILRNMPDGYRAVFNLFAIENYTHKEIAGILNITENNSRTQYHKAKNKIRKELEKKYQSVGL